VPVTVLDDLSSTNSSFDRPELRHPRIRCIEGSVCRPDLLGSLVATHRTVAHLASVVGVEETISRTMATVEILGGTLHLARALTADHVVLQTSSADVYGAISHFRSGPMRENDWFVFEDAGVNRWVYPHVKALEENLLSQTPARAVQVRGTVSR
jgi:nucleoside-diphosphate-sugar epimerase